MRSFRHIAVTSLFTIGIFAAVLYTSCTKDACSGVVCQNGGTCSGGTCTCPNGFSGTHCETAWSTPYVGTWTVNETCGGVNSTPYQVIITANSANPTQLLISNLGNYNCTSGTIQFDGTLSSATTFTINENKCSTQMNATGTLNTSNQSISISYTATYGSTTDNCTATLN